MSDLVEVGIGACVCPGSPHPDGDLVYLRPKLGLASGIAVQKLIIEANSAEGLSAADLTGVLAEGYLLHGIAGWNLVDADGRPLAVNPQNIHDQLLNDFERGAPVADKADDLYMAAVLLPLVKKGQSSSPTTPTRESTSRRPQRQPKARKQSKPSSTSTSGMGVTETTSLSLVGASSSSRS